jgi:hypothetical protein
VLLRLRLLPLRLLELLMLVVRQLFWLLLLLLFQQLVASFPHTLLANTSCSS